MKVRDRARIARGTHPLFGRAGTVVAVDPKGDACMLDLDDGGVERV